MSRNGLRALVLIGLSATALVFSFPACTIYTYAEPEGGNCEDDNNPCTMDNCGTGATTHDPKANGEDCTLGINAGACQAGLCVLTCGHGNEPPCNCAADTDCEMDAQCSLWACEAGKCKNTLIDDPMTEVGMAVPGDCSKKVCRSGVLDQIADPDDKPADIDGDCKKFVCDGMTLTTPPDMADIPPDIKGDCKQPSCINGPDMPISDDNDAPPKSECTKYSCSNGMAQPENDSPGTLCMTDTRACDKDGKCAECLSAGDFDACQNLNNMNCPVKRCNGQPCTQAATCQNNACVDGVCCNESCDTACRSCNQTNMVGTCTNVPIWGDDTFNGAASSCKKINGFACDGNGACKLKGGLDCAGNPAACVSGMCDTTCTWLVGEPCTMANDCSPLTCTMAKCM